MSKDTNQASEDELRAAVLTEFKQVHKLAPADYTENCTNVVMSIVQDHTNAEIAKVLDRLAEQSRLQDYSHGTTDSGRVRRMVEAIEAERNKLRENK